jgi:hypothetical protein
MREGTSEGELRRELTKIAEGCCYYFSQHTLRVAPWTGTLLMPIELFGVSALVSLLFVAFVYGTRFGDFRRNWEPQRRKSTAKRAAFLALKLALGLAAVFVAGIELARPEGSFLLAWRDGGSSTFLVWFYILGATAAIFGAVMDQRSRCRECLRLLCFPIRIGSPGSLFLGWAGTELLCTEGHGVLHVPHLAASWEDESNQWVSVDDSLRDLFAEK